MSSISTDDTALISSEPITSLRSVLFDLRLSSKYNDLKFIRIYNHFVLMKPFNDYLIF